MRDLFRRYVDSRIEGYQVLRSSEDAGAAMVIFDRSSSDPEPFLFYETYVDEAAFDLHRNAPHLDTYRRRRAQEQLVDGAVEMEIFRSFTE